MMLRNWALQGITGVAGFGRTNVAEEQNAIFY